MRSEEVPGYRKDQKVLLAEYDAKEREVKGECVPLDCWVDEKDMGESKTDNDYGVGYRPLAVAKRKSNVARSFTPSSGGRRGRPAG